MVIAVNSSHFLKSADNDFVYDYFLKVALSKPGHQFIFIAPFAKDEHQVSSKNISTVISAPAGKHPLMWKIWLNYTLPGIVRKHAIDILINTDAVCSLHTRVKQYIFISDLSFLYPGCIYSEKQQKFLKKNLPSYLHRANKIITIADFLRKEIIQRYAIDEKKIILMRLTAGDLYQPADWIEKEDTRERYAEGKEYFLFSGDINPRNHLLNLLKAFSFFKQRQKSNMQLIIISKSVKVNNPFIESFKTYKHRKEVHILIELPPEDMRKVTAAAYAFVYPSLDDGFAIPPLQAMHCEVPVICSHTRALSEITGEAALYIDPSNFEDIADKMMLVFKDETKRQDMIKKGLLMTQKNTSPDLEDFLWNTFLNN